MKTKKLASAVGPGLVGVALGTALFARRNLLRHIQNLKRSLENSRTASGGCPNLPLEVIALASPLGVPSDGRDRIVRLTQRGEMCFSPGGKPIPFSAEQIISVSQIGFVWHARLSATSGFMQVFDYIANQEAGLEAAILGTVPLVHLHDTDALFRGETMRYLAELMWNPDALLQNDQLVWRVIDERALAVGAGAGKRWSEVRLVLNEAGDVIDFYKLHRFSFSRPKLAPGRVPHL